MSQVLRSLPAMPARTSAIAVPQQDVFPLAELPAELRLKIFRAALVLPTGIVFVEAEHSGPIELIAAAQVQSCLALLSTCRQIREDNLRLFYAENNVYLKCAGVDCWRERKFDWGERGARNIQRWIRRLKQPVRRLWRLVIWGISVVSRVALVLA